MNQELKRTIMICRHFGETASMDLARWEKANCEFVEAVEADQIDGGVLERVFLSGPVCAVWALKGIVELGSIPFASDDAPVKMLFEKVVGYILSIGEDEIDRYISIAKKTGRPPKNLPYTISSNEEEFIKRMWGTSVTS